MSEQKILPLLANLPLGRNAYVSNSISVIPKRTIIPPAKSFSVKRFNRWMYAETKTPMIGISATRTYKDYIAMFTGNISKLYLRRMPTFHIGDELFNRTDTFVDIQNSQAVLIKSIKGLLRKLESDTFECRITGDHYSFVLFAEQRSATSLSYTTMLFDGNLEVCKCCMDGATVVSGSPVLVRLASTPFYIGKKDKTVEKIIRSEKDINLVDQTTIRLVSEAIKCMNGRIVSGNGTSTECYSSTEMYFIKKMIKMVYQEKYWPCDTHNWTTKTERKGDFDKFISITPDFVSMVTTSSNISHYPLIDLSKREFKFIANYVSNNKFLDIEDCKTFNLIPYISDTPYGDNFRYPITYDDWGEIILLTSFILDDETNNLRMFLMYELESEDMIVFSSVDFSDISKFNVHESLNDINSSVIFRDIDKMPSSMENLENMLPPCFSSADDILDIITDIIALYITLHDRPSRTKVIKCTKRIDTGKKKSVSNSKNSRDRDYTVTRILKTTTDAKEYVARMSSEGYRDREYSIESWQRKGYYRRTKNGSVWIQPTTCHRHKPLTEKEIHIKL